MFLQDIQLFLSIYNRIKYKFATAKYFIVIVKLTDFATSILNRTHKT